MSTALLEDRSSRRSANSGRRSGSCVSIDLQFRDHVARACYRSTRAGVCRLPASHTLSTKLPIIDRPSNAAGHCRFAEFPPTKAEAQGIAPTRTFTIRHRLLGISLASSVVRVRLSLSWLSFSSSRDLLPIAGRVASGVLCRQRTTPHASRVERTRLRKPEPHGRDSHPL